MARLTARRQCPQCQRIYNLLSQPPLAEDRCDGDGAALVTREDDREAVIRRRLAAYEAQTGPVLDWYGASGVHRIEADRDPRLIAKTIQKLLIERVPQSALATR